MIREVASRLAAVKPVMLIYTLGITEHTCGVNNVLSCANLQMLLGNVGFECGGVNPLRGQNNVQGACDMGALPNVFPGYQKVADPAGPGEVRGGLGGGEAARQAGPDDAPDDGRPRRRQDQGVLHLRGEPGQYRTRHPAMWNSAWSRPSSSSATIIFPTETTRFADVIFPAAAWSENDGTFANSERRVSRVRTAERAPGPGQTQLVDLQGTRQADGTGVGFQQRPGDLGQRDFGRWLRSWRASSIPRIEKDGLQWPVPTWTIRAHRPCTRTAASPAAWGSSSPWTGLRRRKCPMRNIPSC